MSAPNLDAMPQAELAAFAERIKQAPRTQAHVLFPTRPPGYLKATYDLQRYAELKETAMGFRERGAIEAARHYESACDALYDCLPDFARW